MSSTCTQTTARTRTTASKAQRGVFCTRARHSRYDLAPDCTERTTLCDVPATAGMIRAAGGDSRKLNMLAGSGDDLAHMLASAKRRASRASRTCAFRRVDTVARNSRFHARVYGDARQWQGCSGAVPYRPEALCGFIPKYSVCLQRSECTHVVFVTERSLNAPHGWTWEARATILRLPARTYRTEPQITVLDTGIPPWLA